ncbi:MAG TPA: 5'/3'-nucleotidase SurE [Acidimicrobiales bacterium]|nr:5'/3'-nucleotidase SurE [Acidimicrobiales bacterium]
MRILVTNDDGAFAPGILPLARMAVDAGHDVVLAAPQLDMTGFGAALGGFAADGTIGVKPAELDGLEGVPCFAVDGPPALAVMAARLGGFGDPPELVLSGINPGPNTGRATLHSGTVGAALTAANFGVSALAVSIGVDDEIRWETAATVAAGALEWLIDAEPKTVLNLNVPNVPLVDLKGVRWARLAAFGTVRAALVPGEGGLQMELRAHDEKLPEDSDTALVNAGYASITQIVGIRASDEVPVAEHVETFLRKRA